MGNKMKPRMFIGSSSERLELAYAVQENLEYDVEATVWSQGVFGLSKTNVASLIEALKKSDLGLFILAPDDVAAIRDKTTSIVRDNVIFELGLFVGHLGSDRCFLVVPAAEQDLHLPTDLLGLAPASYPTDRRDGNWQAALGPACNRIRKAVTELGVVRSNVASKVLEASEQTLCDDPGDCAALIQAWLGRHTQNATTFRFDDVDRELRLIPGAARLYIEAAY